MSEIVTLAKEFATNKHFGQKRKYYEADYIVHPRRVAIIVTTVGMPNHVIAAAWLHDTIEDTNTTYEDLYQIFGKRVADLVWELTSPSKQHPQLSREDRKAMDREHISRCSEHARIVKLADRIDNVESLMKPDAPLGFVFKYLAESQQLAKVLQGTHSLLCPLLDDSINYCHRWAVERNIMYES